MRMALGMALGFGSFVVLSMPHSRSAAAPVEPASADTVALASKLTGKWMGSRVESGSTAAHRFTMDWKKAADGHLTGTVTVAGTPAYQTSVVWSSDTAFIMVSAPHRSPGLKEDVVARTVARFQGDSLVGQYELRPTSYAGRTVTGHLSAARKG